jgi:ferric-dicitrate binding protein FerR (iron transport regulator)
MEQDRTWLLLARKISGEATLDELRELEMLLKNEPAISYHASLIKEMELISPNPVTNVDAALEKHLTRLRTAFSEDFAEQNTGNEVVKGTNKRGNIFRAIALAAALLITGTTIWGLTAMNGRRTHKDLLSSEVSTRHGSRSKVTLPDGSTVWLNVSSRLTYDYGKANSRDVTLEGEAYFDVMKDENRPFIIHTRKMDITVLGTAFNVRSYKEDKTVETSLIQGKVEVTIKGDNPEKVILTPNQKIVLPNQEVKAPVATSLPATNKEHYTLSEVSVNPHDSLVAETAWKENYLIFNNERFEDIAVKMERWFDVRIAIQDPTVKNYRFTGTFENETVEETLEALKFTSMFHYNMDKKKIIIKR